LNKEALAARKVENLDIGSNVRDYWSYVVGGPEIDLTKFKSEKTGRGPLTPGWQVRLLSKQKVCNGTTIAPSASVRN
jgi:hypothetical protein